MRNKGGDLYAIDGVAFDMTARKLAEETQDLQKAVLEMVVAGHLLPKILNFLCLQVEDILHQSICSLMLLDDTTGCLNVAAAPHAPEELCAALNGLIPGDKAGSCGTAAYTGEMVIVADTKTDDRWGGCQGLATRFGIKACWSIPILSGGKKVIGTFAVSHAKIRRPTSFEVTLLENISYLAGITIERRRAEEVIQYNEKRYKDLYDSAPVAYVSVSKDGLIQMVNTRFTELMGYSKEELIGRSVIELYAPTPNGKEKAVQLDQQLKEGRQIQGEEFEVEKADGTRFWVSLTIRPIKDANGNLIERRGILEDITVQRQAKFLLTEQNALFEMIAVREPLQAIMGRLCTMIEAAAPDMRCSVYFLNGDTLECIAAPNLPDTYIKKVARIQIGPCMGSCGTAAYRKEPVIVSDIETDPLWERGHRLALGHGLRACWSTPIISSNGSVLGTIAVYYQEPRSPNPEEFTFVETATYVASIAVNKRRSEEALQESEDRYRDLYDSAPLAYVSATSDGVIQMVNSKTAELLGLPKEDIIGRSVVDLFAPTPHGKEKVVRLNQQAKEGREFQGEELELARADGSRRWVSATVRLIHDQHGQIIARRGILEDITDRKQHEIILRHLVEGVAQGTGQQFFHQLVQHLAEVLGVEYAFIGKLIDNQKQVRTLALWANGVPADDFEYVLANTPCQGVVNRSFCVYPAGVQELFPDDRLLVEMEVNSYVGIPLVSSEGQILGLMVAMGKNALNNSNQAKEIFQICAARVSAELERMEGEIALRQMNIALTNAMPGIAQLDGQGHYLAVNDVYANLLGFEPDELIGTSWEPTVHPEDLPIAHAAYQQLLKIGKAEFEARAIRKDGSMFYKQALMVKQRDSQESHTAGHHCFMRDITERKQEEEALKERSKLAAFDAQISHKLTQGRDLQEMLRGCTETIVSHMDAAFARIWTLNEGEQMLELQASSGLYTNVDGPYSRVPVGQFNIGMIASVRKPHLTNSVVGDPLVSDQDWAKREGIMAFAGYPLLIDGQVIGVVAMFTRRYLTELPLRMFESVAARIALGIKRKNAEKALYEHRLFLRQVIDTNPNFIFAKDREGRFTLANQAVAEAYGTTADTLIGKTDAEFNSNADEAEWFRQKDLDVFNSGKELFIAEETMTDAAKKVRWLQTVKRPLFGENGRNDQILGVSTDFTERRRAEQILRTLVEGTATVTSTDFFRSLVSCLASALQVSCAFVAECTDETKNRVRTLAFIKDGDFAPNMEYGLEGTPCRHVIDDNVIYHPRDVQVAYPQDQDLVKLQVQCYLGIPLKNASGEVIGHLAILHNARIEFDSQTESMVKVFAGRAGAELERHQAEQALRESDARVQAVLDGSSSVIYVKDLEGHYLLINRRFEELFNVKREEVKGLTDFYIFPPETATAFRQNDRNVIEKKEPIMVEEIVPHPDGPHTYISNKFAFYTQEGMPYATCGISTDITERKRAEALLKESESRFRAMADSTPVMIWMSGEDSLCTYVNRGWLEFTGRTLDQVEGLGWTESVHADDLQQCLETYRSAFTRRQNFVMEYRLRHQSGEYRWILSSGSPRFSSEGGFLGFIGSCIDISRRKQKEALLRAMEEAEVQFVATADPAKSFGLLLKHLTALTESEYGFIGEVLYTEEGTPYLKTHAISNIARNDETRTPYDRFAPNMEFYNLDTLLGAVVKTGEVVIANDPKSDPRGGDLPKGFPCMDAFLGLPFYYGDRLVGMVGIANRPGGYSQDVVEFLQPLLVSCAMVIDAYQQAQHWRHIQDTLKKSEDTRHTALEERTRLSQDLHDHILQSLYAVGLIIAAAKKPILEDDTEKGIGQLDQGIGQLNSAIGEIRHFIQGLDQNLQAPRNFHTTIVELARTMGESFTTRFDVDVDPIFAQELTHEQELHLSSLVREAMSNTLRHSRATKGWINLRRHLGQIRLEIGDNGIGLDHELRPEYGSGYGLKNMRARVELMKGTIQMLSKPKRGLRILVDLPVNKEADEK